MANGLPATFVSPAMVSRAGAERIAVVAIVLSVFSVPAFSQPDTAGGSASLDRTSFTAAARYDPARTSPRERFLPDNLVATPGLVPIIRTMLERSSMFRRQVARIAGAPDLTVRIEHSFGLLTARRAQTRVVRSGSHCTAVIEITLRDDTVELIAHELEHVIEQLDGVDLRAHARRSHSSVRAIGSDETTFETRRARSVGLVVAQEVRQWQSAAAYLPPRR